MKVWPHLDPLTGHDGDRVRKSRGHERAAEEQLAADTGAPVGASTATH